MLNFCRRKVCRRFQGTLYFGRIIFIPEMRRTDIRSITALLRGSRLTPVPFGKRILKADRRLPAPTFRGMNSVSGYSRMISDHIGMETLFLRKNCLMLHAALIRWQGKGILFTAPSGTGKSTQAGLWEKYEEADILNGDRAAVRKDKNGCWQAYGLPYAGSSGIYRNEKAPVSAIIVLRQAYENRIQRLGMLEIIQETLS